MKNSLLLCLAVLLASSFAFANELQPVATVTNDHDPSVGTLSIILDSQGQVLGLDSVNNHHDGNPPTIVHLIFSVAEIASSSGVVLDTEQGLDIFILRGQIDSQGGTGRLEIQYLANGFWGTYGRCRINLLRSPAGVWQLINAYNGRLVTNIRAITWNFGIKTLQNVCP